MPKKIAYTCLLFLFAFTAKAQYYLRGQVKDEKNQPLQNVKLFLHSSRGLYFSGTAGDFGINSRVLNDSITVSLDGYEPRQLQVRTDVWQDISLKVLRSAANQNRIRLISVTKDFQQSQRFHWLTNDETYFQLVENEAVDAKKYPNTGFSLNINKASYSNVRRFLNEQATVPPDAVRTEELINYFNLHYRTPDGNALFKTESQLTACPWNDKKEMLYLLVSAKKLDMAKVPPGNFVFLIDASGSMDMPNRLPLLKAAFQLFVKNLRAVDTVSIVTYGGTVSIWLPPTGGNEKEKLIKAMEELEPMGDTPGEAGILAAYKLAESSYIKNGNNRVILATDGDFNVGLNSEKELDDLITKERQTGVYLTCLGVGMGNFKDSKLETLAKRGNGNFAYLDNIQEAEKVLVKELTQTMYSVADNVFLNVQFNPAYVKTYRLIGFDNKKDAVADSTLDLEGGEVGSGSSIMAMFEIEGVGEDWQANAGTYKSNLANVTMRYSGNGDTAKNTLNFSCAANYSDFKTIDKDLQFAAGVAMFGLKLKQSKYLKNVDWINIDDIITPSYDPGNYLQADFVQLLEKAKKIYTPRKNKKKKEE